MKYLPPRLATVVTKEIAGHRDLTFGRLLVPSSVSFFSGISIPVLTGGGRPVCRGRAAQRLTSSGRPVPLRVRVLSLHTPDVGTMGWMWCTVAVSATPADACPEIRLLTPREVIERADELVGPQRAAYRIEADLIGDDRIPQLSAAAPD